jgi:hypothetical protein
MYFRALWIWMFFLVILNSGTATAGALTSPGTSTVLGNRITVCFVGDPLTPDAVDFVTQIQGFLRDHEAVANINYDFTGVCERATTDAAGLDVFAGELRVALMERTVPYSPLPNATGQRIIPGNGCNRGVPVVLDTMTNLPIHDPSGNEIDTMASFGIFPIERTPQWDTHCQWNMRMGNDGTGGVPWRNHTLHEFGHSLGFAHEHSRHDARAAIRDAPCSRNLDNTDSDWFSALPTESNGNQLIATQPYDLSSTMNYSVANCGYVGNYSNAGLGNLEKWSLHFMYPENNRVAEYWVRTVLRTGESATIYALWPIRGASLSMNPMITSYSWSIDGLVVSSGAWAALVTIQFPTPGDRQLTLTYTDFAGRTYSYQTSVHVLAPDQFARRISVLGTSALLD